MYLILAPAPLNRFNVRVRSDDAKGAFPSLDLCVSWWWERSLQCTVLCIAPVCGFLLGLQSDSAHLAMSLRSGRSLGRPRVASWTTKIAVSLLRFPSSLGTKSVLGVCFPFLPPASIANRKCQTRWPEVGGGFWFGAQWRKKPPITPCWRFILFYLQFLSLRLF